jgi:selenide,water dikinase
MFQNYLCFGNKLNMEPETSDIRLTMLSHGTGCGCKIAAGTLHEILAGSAGSGVHPQLLVGNAQKDDAAAWDLGDGNLLLSTTDFFMPIVDDPFDFGRIASANALSDIFAMGGRPIFALAVLAFPVDKLPIWQVQRILDGCKAVCEEAGIPLAGGHSIDNPEPIFGLAVNGLVKKENLKKNGGAKPGDLLYLTKPLGVGLLTTVVKMGLLPADELGPAVALMTKLNSIGAKVATLPEVSAMTDVTGFGLLGHLFELCDASGASARLFWDKVPVLDKVSNFLYAFCLPKGANNNLAAFGQALVEPTDAQRFILADPQTSGGLLIAVNPDGRGALEALLGEAGLYAEPIGEVVERVEEGVQLFL